MITTAKVDRSRSALIIAALAVLPDLERHASTHGPGPDRRMEQLRDILPTIPEGYRLATPEDERFTLLAPTGEPIIGTNETIPGTARVRYWTREMGTLTPEYEGGTDVAWDGQESVDDEVIDTAGDIWHESDCIPVVEV